jgi:F0F1-type ATP synthase assembly protein I
MAAASLVGAVPASALAGALLGAGLDSLLDTGRWCTVVLLFGGFAVGIVQLFRGLARLPSQTAAHPPDPPS